MPRRFLVLALGLCACQKDEAPTPKPLADDRPTVELTLVENGAIAGSWKRLTEDGEAKVAAEGNGAVFFCEQASFSLNQELTMDPDRHTNLSWRWRVDEHPKGGDVRDGDTDDQAAQVVLRFEGDKIVSYIWDAGAPAGYEHSYLVWPIRAVVLRSGADGVGQWQSEERNIAADYKRVWGEDPGLLTGIRLQSNCQHTQSAAKATFEAPVFAVPI